DILAAPTWYSYVHLSDFSRQQLQFWEQNIDVLNERSFCNYLKCSKIVYSDASNSGFAGYEMATINGVAHGTWSPEESQQSSTWRELMA
ncbi:hypothetical protein ScPMuIL_003133, partial [Solemya velum]